MNKIGQHLQRQAATSPRKDDETNWVKLVKEIKISFASGNNQRPLKLIPTTGGWQSKVIGTAYDRNGEPILGIQ